MQVQIFPQQKLWLFVFVRGFKSMQQYDHFPNWFILLFEYFSIRPCARLDLNLRNAEWISTGYEELSKFDIMFFFLIHILWPPLFKEKQIPRPNQTSAPIIVKKYDGGSAPDIFPAVNKTWDIKYRYRKSQSFYTPSE